MTDIVLMLKSFFPNKMNVKFTIDDFRLRMNLTNIKTMKYTKKFGFCTFLGFSQFHSGPFGDIEGFAHLIPRHLNAINPLTLPVLIKFI